MINRKAALGSQTMIYTYMIIWLLIISGIVWGVVAFFGGEYDFRETDATLLNYRIQNCLLENNLEIPTDIKKEREQFEKEFYETCSIAQNVTNEIFLIHLNFGDENIYKAGPGDPTQCALSDKNPNYPKCITSTITKNDQTTIILTGSNQKKIERRT